MGCILTCRIFSWNVGAELPIWLAAWCIGSVAAAASLENIKHPQCSTAGLNMQQTNSICIS